MRAMRSRASRGGDAGSAEMPGPSPAVLAQIANSYREALTKLNGQAPKAVYNMLSMLAVGLASCSFSSPPTPPDFL